jgi:hypothetical protein
VSEERESCLAAVPSACSLVDAHSSVLIHAAANLVPPMCMARAQEALAWFPTLCMLTLPVDSPCYNYATFHDRLLEFNPSLWWYNDGDQFGGSGHEDNDIALLRLSLMP